MSKTTAIAIASLLVPAAASAQPISRADVVARAAEHPEVRAAEAEIEGARAQKRQANALRWPDVTLDLGVGNSLQADLVPGTAVQSTESTDDIGLEDLSAVFAAELTVVQPLYTFGKIANRRSAADHGIRARRAQARAQGHQVALTGVEYYEGYLFARDAERFFEEIEHTLERSLQSTRDRLEKGDAGVSESDVLRLDTALAAAKLGMNRASAARRRAAAALRAHFGRPPGDSVEVADAELEALEAREADVQALIAQAVEARPEIRALEAGSAAFDDLADAERAAYYPDIVAVGFLSAAYTPGREWLDTRYVRDPLNHFTPGILLGLRWQLQADFAGGRADAERAEARRLERLEQWARDAIPAEVRDAYEELERARADISAADDAAEAAKKWVVRTNADYVVGLTDARDLTDAVSAYAQARTAQLDARYRFNLRLASLSRAVGALGGEGSLYPGRNR